MQNSTNSDGAMPIALRGHALLANALLNKGIAFPAAERDAFGLHGILPSRIGTIEEQVKLELEHVRRKTHDDLEKYIGLAALQDRNETLYYRVLLENLEEFLPIVYTPTVGKACQEFSHIFRRSRGVWITPDDLERMPDLLENAAHGDVRLIVVTDNERILGLGDQGLGGIGISIGKLALYTAAAGIHPSQTLPISLDVGTDRRELLDDPLYLGWRRPRLRGAAYDEVVERFVQSVKEVFPRAILQWEDFKQENALRVLNRFRKRLSSFNDDVQGTAGVVVAGVLAGLRRTGQRLCDQRIVFLGAGASGLGIAHLLGEEMRSEGASEETIHASILSLDSKGLVYEGREAVDEFKHEVALRSREMRLYGFEEGVHYGLEEVVRRSKPTILIGATGRPKAFTEMAIREMARSCAVPIIFPLSNPTSNCEAVPADLLEWTDGRAIMATGSPFAPVDYHGVRHVIGQANNVFIFPGVGLGAMVAGAREISDRLFLVAARVLAATVTPERLASGALYPSVSALRTVSRTIAIAVADEVYAAGLSTRTDPLARASVEKDVDAAMWYPEYRPYRPV